MLHFLLGFGDTVCASKNPAKSILIPVFDYLFERRENLLGDHVCVCVCKREKAGGTCVVGQASAMGQVFYTLHLIQSSGHLWEPWLNHESCVAVKETLNQAAG